MQAALHEGLRELGRRRGDADVAAQRQVHPGAGGRAVDGGDDRLRRIPHGQQRQVAIRRDLLAQRPLAPTFLGLVHGLDVAAGAEALARAGDDDHAHVRIVAALEDGVVQIVTQSVAERVQALGAIQREGGDAVLELEEQALVSHVVTLSPRRAARECSSRRVGAGGPGRACGPSTRPALPASTRRRPRRCEAAPDASRC